MTPSQTDITITARSFGLCQDGRAVKLWQLRHASGLEVDICERGATLIAIRTPDRDGTIENILVGFDNLAGCEADPFYMGVLVGRFANRIADGRFVLDGQSYQLDCHEEGYHLHGGCEGFHKAIWAGEVEHGADGPSLVLRYVSPDGESGYPGALSIEVGFTLFHDRLQADYRWQSDAPTIVNLTHHPYFNLSAGRAPSVAGHKVQISADRITQLSDLYLPTGELRDVSGTHFDLREGYCLPQTADWVRDGFDQNYALNAHNIETPVARLVEPISGRQMDLYTDQPGLQFYTGQYLSGVAGAGTAFLPGGGLCLETQGFPDAPNHAHFPSTVARPGKVYRSQTAWQFSIGP